MNIREVIARLNPYVKWTQVKEFAPHGVARHSQSVCELPNGVIRKTYDSANPVHKEWFDAERRILDFLTRMGCAITPKLLFADEQKTTLYMSKCGDAPKAANLSSLFVPQAQTPEAVAEGKRRAQVLAKQAKKESIDVDRVMRDLEQKYGLSYKPNAGKKLYSYPAHQTARRDGKIFILDFHDPKMWTLNPPKNVFAPIQDLNPITPTPGFDQVAKAPVKTPPNPKPTSNAIQ